MIWLDAAAAFALICAAPLATWIERRVKAWSQLRRGPPMLQPYRDIRKLWTKRPLVPNTASPAFRWAPGAAIVIVALAILTLPLAGPAAPIGGGVALVVLALLLTVHRVLVAVQAYDTGTAFGGLGTSRELFLGGLGEPVFLLVVAGIFLHTGQAAVPGRPLDVTSPSAWLLGGALVILWISEAARIPFDNPATHLELTMVHEALLLESNGWMLALHEFAAWIKQSTLAALICVLFLPLPSEGPARVTYVLLGAVVLSGLLAFFESAIAKVRLFRASHLLVMAALLAFFGGAVTYLERGAL